MSAILLETNGMVIREDTRFWIYVITHKQWTRLNHNLENDILYCSAYAMYGVRKNDIIMIYKKDPKIGGFVGVAQVYSDMHSNTKGISIYGDHNMDNNLIEFEQITLLSIPIKISKITCFAQTIYKKYQSFSKKMLQGECSLREMDKKSGFVLIDYLIKTTTIDLPTTQTTLDTLEQPIDTDEQPIDSKIEPIIDELIERQDPSDCESDEEMKNMEMKKARRCGKYIPVMLCGCKLIEKGVQKIIQNKGGKKPFNENDFLELMMRHYDDCDECEFTNNNDGDIGRIIRRISSDNVHIYFDHTETDDTIEEMMNKTFDSYLLADPYSSSDGEHLNIYLIDDHEYKGAIVFEWMIK